MSRLLIELIIGPLLVGGSALVGRRWGVRPAGIVSAFPAVVGPVLLITAGERGSAFAAHAAIGTLLGLIALSGFALAYARVAVSAEWRKSLLVGWACAALIAGMVGYLGRGAGLPAGLAGSGISLFLAHRAMPRPGVDLTNGPGTSGSLTAQMTVTALLVASLAGAAMLFGAFVGGMLTALPILASVLAAFTHRSEGCDAVLALLRGMLGGMAGFVAFCAAVALLIVPAGPAWAFAAAASIALCLQLLAFVPARPARC